MKIPKCIKAVAKNAETDGRRALGYVRCEADMFGAYRYVASDGRQLVCVSLGDIEKHPDTVLLVNAKQLAKAAPKASEQGGICWDGSQAFIEKESGTSKLDSAEMKYPDYRSAFKHQLEGADYRPIRLDAKRLKAFCDTVIAARKDAHFTLYMSDKERAICITTESDDGERIHGMLMPLADDCGRELPDVREAMNLDGVTEEVTA